MVLISPIGILLIVGGGFRLMLNDEFGVFGGTEMPDGRTLVLWSGWKLVSAIGLWSDGELVWVVELWPDECMSSKRFTN